jgi:3-deoxy-manno-octulosonate cytidylyltransferase (CMP-KDO synthetase)
MPAKHRAIGVIPARWGSTRFPGKSLAPILGEPLIAWVIRNARRAATLDSLVVATDDERICRAAAEAGVEAVMTRPDHPSGTDRIAEAIAGQDADIVVNIQGDEPLIDPGLIDRLVEKLEDASWQMSTAATPIRDPQRIAAKSVVKVVCAEDGAALYFSRSVIPAVRDADDAPCNLLYLRHLGVYGYRRDFLARLVATPPCMTEQAEKLEQLRALHLGGRIAVIQTDDEGIGVDTPEDVAYVEQLLTSRRRGVVH